VFRVDQLKQVAKIMSVRAQLGSERDVFVVKIGDFDTVLMRSCSVREISNN
jgi:uncharacterized protein (DUF1501 family)